MRAHGRLLPAQVLRPRLGEPCREELRELGAGESLHAVAQAAPVLPRESLGPRDAAVGLPHLLREAREEPQPRVEQRGAARRDRGVPGIEQSQVGTFLLEQAVALLDGARIGREQPRVPGVRLPAKAVELVSPARSASLYQAQVVGGKEDRHERAGDVRRVALLAVARELPAAGGHVAAHVDHAPVAREASGDPRRLRTLAHELRGRGATEREARREHLQGLDRVRLARRVGAHEHRGRGRERDPAVLDAAEVHELESVYGQAQVAPLPLTGAPA